MLIGLIFFVSLKMSTSWADEPNDKILILPLFGYSDEQGLGVGANATWLNMAGSPWTIDTSLFSSAIYGQTYLSANVTDRKFFDDLYFQMGGFANRSTRALFY